LRLGIEAFHATNAGKPNRKKAIPSCALPAGKWRRFLTGTHSHRKSLSVFATGAGKRSARRAAQGKVAAK
jgi:hypothetical protein